ncbi:MAG: addiction module protein [Bacteroidota bacterium]
MWDSIAADNEPIELTQEQKDELDRRSEWFRQNPGQGRTWEEIKAEHLKSR